MARDVEREWEECPREARDSRWATMYVTLNPEGDIVMNRATHKATGSPDSYVLLYDRQAGVIGMKAASSSVHKNAYPARPRGHHGGRRVRGYRLCREFGIRVGRTVRFPRCRLDKDGVLLLELSEAKAVRK